jgi:hypothetical protein
MRNLTIKVQDEVITWNLIKCEESVKHHGEYESANGRRGSMIIYISGPMTGYPELNYPAFQNAAQQLRELGYAVISPHEVEPLEQTWVGYMRADIKALMDCQKVVTLSGWENSRGARIEVNLAKELGMKVVDYESLIAKEETA